MKELSFPALVVLINGLVPLILLLWDVYRSQVGANPVEFVTRTTGTLTLIFLLLTLAITPIRRITGQNSIIKYRRMLGLFAFFYGSIHFLTYVWFDRAFGIRATIADVAERPFIAVGFVALLLMVPLATTSTKKMVKRLGGKRWQRLHRIVYLAAIGGVVHYWMLVKFDTRLPLTFGFILLLLLGHRLFVKYFPPENPVTLFPRN